MLADVLGMPPAEWATQQVRDNQMLVAIVGGMLLGSALYITRSIPTKLWRLFLLQFTVVVEIHNDTSSYEEIMAFLVNKGIVHNNVRRLTIDKLVNKEARNMAGDKSTGFGGNDEGQDDDQLALGRGLHFFWYRGRPFLLDHTIGEPKMRERPRTITLRTFGRSRAIMSQLIDEANRMRAEAIQDQLSISSYSGRCWVIVTRKTLRPLDTVVIDAAQKERLTVDLEWFMENPDWYASRGIPYRRGYLFYGPPGTGKTSLIFALASHYRVPVYMLNLSTMLGDDALMNAMGDLPDGVFLLIEDIDATGAHIEPRKAPVPRTSDPMDTTESDDEPDNPRNAVGMGVTLSGLMNALDGIASPDRLVTFMTTNHPEHIEPALLRPGRVDRKEEIGHPGYDEAHAMFRRFFPDDDGLGAAAFARAYTRQAEVVTAADLQELCMEHAGDPAGAVGRMDAMSDLRRSA